MIPILLLAMAIAAPTKTSDVHRAISTIHDVGPNGKGGPDAALAWKQLAGADVSDLPAILAGMDGASPLARNWIRAAIDPVLERANRDQKPLPYKELEAFLSDTRHDPTARRFAYELIVKNDAKAPDRFLPKFLDDPSPELRRDAVARLLIDAAKLAQDEKKDEAKSEYRKAAWFRLATSAKCLKSSKRVGELGEKVSLADHAGYLRSWKAIGPFANAENKGLDVAHPPESKLDFGIELDGMNGKVRWKEFTSTKDNGVVDLNEAVGEFPEAVCYVATEFLSKDARAEVRLGSFIAFKLWVNGELVLVRGDAYTGMKQDHYVAPVKLKAGVNTILVKFGQEPPPPQLPKPNHWRFLLRVCDSSGAAVKSEG